MASQMALFIDDNEQQLRLVEAYAQIVSGVSFDFTQSLEDASKAIGKRAYDLVFLDNRLHPYESWVETLPVLHMQGYVGPVAVISADIHGAMGHAAPTPNHVTFVDKSELGLSGFKSLMQRLL